MTLYLTHYRKFRREEGTEERKSFGMPLEFRFVGNFFKELRSDPYSSYYFLDEDIVELTPAEAESLRAADFAETMK